MRRLGKASCTGTHRCSVDLSAFVSTLQVEPCLQPLLALLPYKAAPVLRIHCLNATILFLPGLRKPTAHSALSALQGRAHALQQGRYSQDAAKETQTHFSLKKAREVAGRKMADDPPTTA